MNSHGNSLYSPALRMKAGELAGLRDLAPDVAAHIAPRLIMPPKAERDVTDAMLFKFENRPDFSAALTRHWANRPAFIDASYLFDEYGRNDLSSWFPQMFHRARRAGAKPIPVALLRDLIRDEHIQAFRSALDRQDLIKLVICVSFEEMVGPEFSMEIHAALARLEVTASDCAVIADFHDADFSSADRVAPIIGGSLQSLQEIGMWRLIIFQGSHYPEVNPATPGSVVRWPRNELKAWLKAVKFDPETAVNMLFGDYAADCSKILFGKSGARAIRHYRYATPDSWLIIRGAETGDDSRIMRDVCRKILESGEFSGPGFSMADEFIYRTAHEAGGPGNATNWRQVNTTHHLTQTIAALGKVRGVEISARPVSRASEQLELLPSR